MLRVSLALLCTVLFATGCDGLGLTADPTFTFDLEEGASGTIEGQGYSELSCGFSGCSERIVFEGPDGFLLTFSSGSTSLSRVNRTIQFARNGGTSAGIDLDGFGRSLDAFGNLTIRCEGDRVSGSVELIASFNERPGEPVELTGDFDVPRTAAESWRDPLPPCE